jgi:hypothetical protein
MRRTSPRSRRPVRRCRRSSSKTRYAPLGMYFQPTAFYSYLTDVPEGIPQFYRIKRV